MHWPVDLSSPARGRSCRVSTSSPTFTRTAVGRSRNRPSCGRGRTTVDLMSRTCDDRGVTGGNGREVRTMCGAVDVRAPVISRLRRVPLHVPSLLASRQSRSQRLPLAFPGPRTWSSRSHPAGTGLGRTRLIHWRTWRLTTQLLDLFANCLLPPPNDAFRDWMMKRLKVRCCSPMLSYPKYILVARRARRSVAYADLLRMPISSVAFLQTCLSSRILIATLHIRVRRT